MARQAGPVSWIMLGTAALNAAGVALLGLFFLPLRLPHSLGAAPLPIAVLAVAVIMPLLVSAAARFGPAPWAAVMPPVVWLVTIMMFGLGGPGGDRVLLGDWRALLLLAAGLGPAAVLLGRMLGRAQLPAPGRDADVGSGQRARM